MNTVRRQFDATEKLMKFQVNELLSPTERIWLSWHGHLRVCGYIGTVADLYTRLTGQLQPGDVVLVPSEVR